MYFKYYIYSCGFFGPVDLRENCFGPCVDLVAAAYAHAAVIDSARYTGIRWLIKLNFTILYGPVSNLNYYDVHLFITQIDHTKVRE